MFLSILWVSTCQLRVIQSFAAKGNFIKKNALRGFAMWEAGGDNDVADCKAWANDYGNGFKL